MYQDTELKTDYRMIIDDNVRDISHTSLNFNNID